MDPYNQRGGPSNQGGSASHQGGSDYSQGGYGASQGGQQPPTGEAYTNQAYALQQYGQPQQSYGQPQQSYGQYQQQYNPYQQQIYTGPPQVSAGPGVPPPNADQHRQLIQQSSTQRIQTTGFPDQNPFQQALSASSPYQIPVDPNVLAHKPSKGDRYGVWKRLYDPHPDQLEALKQEAKRQDAVNASKEKEKRRKRVKKAKEELDYMETKEDLLGTINAELKKRQAELEEERAFLADQIKAIAKSQPSACKCNLIDKFLELPSGKSATREDGFFMGWIRKESAKDFECEADQHSPPSQPSSRPSPSSSLHPPIPPPNSGSGSGGGEPSGSKSRSGGHTSGGSGGGSGKHRKSGRG